MALETFGSHPLSVIRSQQWFEQLLKFQISILVVLSLCILLLPCVHSYDNSLGLSDDCKSRCDHNRQPGWIGEYELDCEKEYAGESRESQSITYCKGQCDDCPKSVCDRGHTFNCPATELEGACRAFCEQNRKGNLDGFLINCKQAFTNAMDVFRCEDICRQCPHWVCNSRMPDTVGNAYVFHCPGIKFDDKCKKRCEHYRDLRFPNQPWKTGEFEFPCYYIDKDERGECETCKDCDKSMCQKDRHGTIRWNCPSTKGPNLLPTSTTAPPPPPPSYEGPCKERCDKFRLGRSDKYKLDCNSLFEPGSADLKKCVSDCNRCPEDNCPSSSDRKIFLCPKSDDYVDWESKYDTLQSTNSSLASEKMTAIIFAVILGTLLASSLCAHFIFRRRQKPGVAIANPGATMSMQQIQSQVQQQMLQTSTTNPPS